MGTKAKSHVSELQLKEEINHAPNKKNRRLNKNMTTVLVYV